MNNPTVTVLMPAYNAEAFIAEAIESVLAQSFQHFELLIIDDGSTDKTAEIISRYQDPRIRHETNPLNLRLIKTLNRGLELACGKYIARLDADDIALPHRLEKQVAKLEQEPSLALIGGQVITMKQTPNGYKCLKSGISYPVGQESVKLQTLVRNPFCHSAVMFRKAVVRTAGGYPEWAINVEDLALWSKLLKEHFGDNLPEVVCKYRVHSESILRKAAANVCNIGSDPRVSLAAQIYGSNALALTGDASLAKKWAEVWPLVSYRLANEVHLRSVAKLFEKLIAGFDTKYTSPAWRQFYGKLFHNYFSQRLYTSAIAAKVRSLCFKRI